MVEKIKITKIQIGKAEGIKREYEIQNAVLKYGKIALRYCRYAEAKTIEEANKILDQFSYDVDSNQLGCDKTDVIIHFEDGSIYQFQADLKHPSSNGYDWNETNIAKHIKNTINFYLGRKNPSNITKEQYKAIIQDIPLNNIEFLRQLETNYAIE